MNLKLHNIKKYNLKAFFTFSVFIFSPVSWWSTFSKLPLHSDKRDSTCSDWDWHCCWSTSSLWIFFLWWVTWSCRISYLVVMSMIRLASILWPLLWSLSDSWFNCVTVGWYIDKLSPMAFKKSRYYWKLMHLYFK